MFCAADGQNAAVRMLRFRPDAETCGTTACEAVSEEVIARSAVLTSIYEAGGDAMLPGSVTLAGFRIWQHRGYHDPNTELADFASVTRCVSANCVRFKTSHAPSDMRSLLLVLATIIIASRYVESFLHVVTASVPHLTGRGCPGRRSD